MKIAARGGNRLHAPENTPTALLAAYAAGADVLQLDVRPTRDGQLVVTRDPTLDRLTGQPGRVSDMDLADVLRQDVSATFRPRHAAAFQYYSNPRHRMAMETLPELLDLLPPDIELLLGLGQDTSLPADRRDAFVLAVADCLHERELTRRTVLYASDADSLALARHRVPGLRIVAYGPDLDPAGQLALMRDLEAQGLMTEAEMVLDRGGQLSDFGRQLEQQCQQLGVSLGAVLVPRADPGVFTQAVYEALAPHAFIWALATDSLLDVGPFVRPGFRWLEEDFAGREVNTRRWALGYAKANRYAHVYQADGIHIDIRPYDGLHLPPPADEVRRRLAVLEEQMLYVAKDWPYYSGGGLGLVRGITGAFRAEVDYTVGHVGQATTLEMAVLNVDPGAHQPPWERDGVTQRLPRSFRDKDSFYDPHGAPPYVGVEHDEDDGYRINWNLGTEYDNNQYGRPVGDGRRPRAGRLRLDRRGPFFAAYYRNAVDAPDWVCVGVARNDSLQPQVFLRCAAKRWRQEDPANPGMFQPIVANEFVFRNLTITRFPTS